MCRMLTHGERRNDFAVWTVRTHLFRVRRSSHFPSSLPSSTTTSTALLCRTVCEGPSPFGRKATTGLTFTGQTDRLRDVRSLCVRVLTKTDKRPSQRARTADGGARYIVRATVVHWHRSTALECGLWCAWFAFLHITSPVESRCLQQGRSLASAAFNFESTGLQSFLSCFCLAQTVLLIARLVHPVSGTWRVPGLEDDTRVL